MGVNLQWKAHSLFQQRILNTKRECLYRITSTTEHLEQVLSMILVLDILRPWSENYRIQRLFCHNFKPRRDRQLNNKHLHCTLIKQKPQSSKAQILTHSSRRNASLVASLILAFGWKVLHTPRNLVPNMNPSISPVDFNRIAEPRKLV